MHSKFMPFPAIPLASAGGSRHKSSSSRLMSRCSKGPHLQKQGKNTSRKEPREAQKKRHRIIPKLSKPHLKGKSTGTKTGKPWTWNISAGVMILSSLNEKIWLFRISAGISSAQGERCAACVVFMKKVASREFRGRPACSRHFLRRLTKRGFKTLFEEVA